MHIKDKKLRLQFCCPQGWTISMQTGVWWRKTNIEKKSKLSVRGVRGGGAKKRWKSLLGFFFSLPLSYFSLGEWHHQCFLFFTTTTKRRTLTKFPQSSSWTQSRRRVKFERGNCGRPIFSRKTNTCRLWCQEVVLWMWWQNIINRLGSSWRHKYVLQRVIWQWGTKNKPRQDVKKTWLGAWMSWWWWNPWFRFQFLIQHKLLLKFFNHLM